jgi:hypothetical protein
LCSCSKECALNNLLVLMALRCLASLSIFFGVAGVLSCRDRV